MICVKPLILSWGEGPALQLTSDPILMGTSLAPKVLSVLEYSSGCRVSGAFEFAFPSYSEVRFT